jgi:CRP/FNR family transcriptional regulator, anaerobic regulatory protein
MQEFIDSYLQYLLKICPSLLAKELRYFQNGMNIIQLPTKHFLIHSGEVQKQIGFVASGLLRAFYIDDNGNEITIRFIAENNFATDYPAFICQAPSKYYIQCLEPSCIINLSYNYVQQGYDTHAGLERFGRLIAEAVLKSQQKRIESFLFDNAETRYINFVNDYPDLFNRVSLSYLSTYLGIERQSLSRIRKKISQK